MLANHGRVLRVVFCACGWQYGANWPWADCYGYWGDCPRCGGVTKVRSGYVLGDRTRREAGNGLGPAQQEMGLC